MLKRLWPWLIILAFILASLWFIPQLQVQSKTTLNEKERIELENDTRRTWAQILGGIMLALTVYFTWRRVQAVEQNVRAAEKNLEIAREGQITERFTRAIEQLGATDNEGNPKMEIRLGGIYALERIARDSQADHWTVMEVLTAYVRRNSPLLHQIEKEPIQLKTKKEKENGSQENETFLPKLPPDIQAICQILRRRKVEHEKGENRRLDLSNTALIRLNLEGIDFKRAYLAGANLQGDFLKGANLQGAYLKGANLKGTYLEGANLKGAYLEGACLIGADLQGADLQGADLQGADLIGTNLQGAYLQRANLQEDYLQRANLKGANLKGADLQGAYLAAADLTEADLKRANLIKAKGLTIEQLCDAETLYEAKLDEDLLNKVKEKCTHLLKNPDLESKKGE